MSKIENQISPLKWKSATLYILFNFKLKEINNILDFFNRHFLRQIGYDLFIVLRLLLT
jgi:hypothetical protein